LSDQLIKESVQILNKSALNVLAAMHPYKTEAASIIKEEPSNPFDVPLLDPKGKQLLNI
jgi:hypothetical protein